jgi:TM2 domain-containing membrane protein YozV
MKAKRSFIFECPACEDLIETDTSMSGTSSKCPHCRQRLVVPKPCLFCGEVIPDSAMKCVHCGEYLDGRVVRGGLLPKSRGIYIILGLLFGTLGIHNFYAGRYGVGAAQCILTVLLCWTYIVPFLVVIWALVELFVQREDGAGNPMV